MNRTNKCKARVYVLEGFNFASRDRFSLSDPYLVLRMGATEFNESENYQLDTADPTFYKCYEFIIDLPGSPVLEIEAFDYNDFFGDELIGSTYIDLDDRFFS